MADDHSADPKGWTGPKEIDGKQDGGLLARHQVPLGECTKTRASEAPGRMDEELQPGRTVRRKAAHSKPNWRSWRQRASGAWAPILTPTAVCCSEILRLPDFRDYAVGSQSRVRDAEATRVMGNFLRDVMKRT